MDSLAYKLSFELDPSHSPVVRLEEVRRVTLELKVGFAFGRLSMSLGATSVRSKGAASAIGRWELCSTGAKV